MRPYNDTYSTASAVLLVSLLLHAALLLEGTLTLQFLLPLGKVSIARATSHQSTYILLSFEPGLLFSTLGGLLGLSQKLQACQRGGGDTKRNGPWW
jgi:hypothetical protein